MQTWIVAGVVAGLAQDRLRLDFRPIVHQHARSDRAAIRFHSLQLDLEPVLFRPSGHCAAERRLIHVHDQHVHIAVVVEVAESASAAAVWRRDSLARL